MKIIVSAGGTGGHIYPALAIIEKFKEKEKNLEVLYIGTHNRMEKDIIKSKGYKYIGLEVFGLSKSNMIRNIKNVYLVDKAQKECLKIIKEFKPDIVIGTGGYVIYPVLKAAKKLGVKTFIHEQNSIAGKSNKWISKDVDLVGVAFKSTISQFSNSKKVFYAGNPCSNNAINSQVITKRSLGFKKKDKLVLVVAGSLGSKAINDKFKLLLKLLEKESYSMVYLTGENHYEEFIKGEVFPKNVVILPSHDNLTGLMKSADLVITRAGASTLSEVLALKKPSLIIPSPYVANNHQYYNAIDLENMGVAKVLEEKNITLEKLVILIDEMLTDKYNKKISKNYMKVKTIDSADIIYKKIKEII